MFFEFIFISTSILIFLLGMYLVKTGLESLALNKAKKHLAGFTATPFRGLITGTVATFIIQSSSAVTVMTVSLVNSGLLSLKQAIGIVLGTNIGTCITALFFTFDILKYYPGLAICGLLLVPAKKPVIKYSGVILIGFSLVFWGLISIQQSFMPLKENKMVYIFLATMGESYLTGILAGAFFTGLIQSSSAATGVIIALAMQNMITLPGALALILGSNVGTCITALLAGITATRSARQVAYAHILLNLAGVAIFYPFITPFAIALTYLAPTLPTQVAWGQIIFNVLISFFALPFANHFAKFLSKL